MRIEGQTLTATDLESPSSKTVYVLSGYAAMGDHVISGPRVFASFDDARDWVNETGQPGCGRGGWWGHRAGRALKWRDRRDHRNGFWEILTTEIQP